MPADNQGDKAMAKSFTVHTKIAGKHMQAEATVVQVDSEILILGVKNVNDALIIKEAYLDKSNPLKVPHIVDGDLGLVVVIPKTCYLQQVV